MQRIYTLQSVATFPEIKIILLYVLSNCNNDIFLLFGHFNSVYKHMFIFLDIGLHRLHNPLYHKGW